MADSKVYFLRCGMQRMYVDARRKAEIFWREYRFPFNSIRFEFDSRVSKSKYTLCMLGKLRGRSPARSEPHYTT
jgi:hypothetical protein